MGNEQSSSSSASTVPSTSTFSFLAGRAASLKKSKGIIVVRDGANKQESIEEDEMYKRFQIDISTSSVTNHLVEKKKSYDKFLKDLQNVTKIHEEVVRIQAVDEVKVVDR
uniref:BLOC-1-related complex subunit 5 n=1 Tax=Heterorhabditis bacteriophora TaxID=37862 RepID=A0A1I7WWM2_HETBA